MALTIGSTSVEIKLSVLEYKTGIGLDAAAVSQIPHAFEFIKSYAQGTGSLKNDSVYVGNFSSAVATTLDLRGVLTSVLDGSTVSFPIVTAFAIYNRSTTSGEYLTVGAGSNPFITWLGATGDAVICGPSGAVAFVNPIDGYATTAGTGDVLTITPATGTIEFDIIIIGRQS